MRRFLTALAVFSVLVMSQNVLAITPATEAASALGSTPDPVSLALLVLGLSGLAAAGDRPVARKLQWVRN